VRSALLTSLGLGTTGGAIRAAHLSVFVLTTVLGCGGRATTDAGLDVGTTPDATAADAPEPVPSGIEAVLAAPDGPADLEVRDVLVTFLRPGLFDDLPGFFVQGYPSGPALVVQVDPASAGVSVGDRVRFRVTAVETRISHKRASAVADVEVTSSGNDVAFLAQDVSDATDLVTNLSGYAHELVSADVTIRGPGELAGVGFTRATVSTAAVRDEPRLQLRLPAMLWDSYPLVEGCTLRAVATPLWGFNDVAQLSAWESGSLADVRCP
jgi:hypothetical protein